jgi:hypothetical protein
LNENETLILKCKANELVGGKCTVAPLSPAYTTPFTGDKYNHYYGYDKYTIEICFIALAVYIVSCRVAAYLALRFIKI